MSDLQAVILVRVNDMDNLVTVAQATITVPTDGVAPPELIAQALAAASEAPGAAWVFH